MKLILKIFGYCLLIYVSMLVGLFMAQRDMMYFPVHAKPAIQGMGIIGLEEINVQTDDGLTLFGWYKAPMNANRQVIIWFHGNTGDVSQTANSVLPFIHEGYGVLMPEYRGFSTNPGTPSEKGFYSDARAFMLWLQAQGVPETRTIVYGQSLGSGPAVQMANEFPLVSTLVLEAPFTSALDVASRNYPFVPTDMMLKDRYDNMSKIKSIRAPLIVVHGERDTVIPFIYGKTLFDAAPEPKSMIAIPDGGHNNLYESNIQEKIISLLAE